MGQEPPPDPKPDPSEPTTPNVNFVDPDMKLHLQDKSHFNHQRLVDFFSSLAINHSVMPEVDSKGQLIYSASSPDEGALVYGAKHFGFDFQQRDPNGIVVNVFGVPKKIDIMCTIDFTSARKRSSVICKIPDDNGGFRYMLYCKGADNIIAERLAANERGEGMKVTFKAMEDFALDGLRTLCIGGRELDGAFAEQWLKEWDAASVDLQDRQGKMDAVAEKIECDLQLLGCTGIEDKLQDEVGDTIACLAEAGVKVWMLTGDKIETAINIGVATSLLTNDMDRLVFDFEEMGEDKKAVQRKLHEEAHKLRLAVKAQEASGPLGKDGKPLPPSPDQEVPGSNLAVIMDGACLHAALSKDSEIDFIDLCKNCKAVICCRVSPEQKGSVVRAVRKHQGKVTLAIGDGANDCNMIQSAHVGVGLRGEEGLQAFNVSDVGLAQFRFLKVLLLVHGRWSYRRISKLVLYMFYKNIVLVMPFYWFAIISFFSGQKLYFEYLYQLFNITFTAIPIMVFGVLDQDVNKQDSLDHPQLYTLGHRNYYFTNFIFVQWLLNGMWHSVVCFLIPYYLFSGEAIAHPDGKASDLWMMGAVIYLMVVLIVNLKVVLETYYLTWITHVSVFGSILFWFIVMAVFSASAKISPELLGTLWRLCESPMFWMCLILCPGIALARDFAWKAFRRTFMPELYHRLQVRYQETGEPPRVVKPKRKRTKKQMMLDADGGLIRSGSIDRGYAFTAADGAVVELLNPKDRDPENSPSMSFAGSIPPNNSQSLAAAQQARREAEMMMPQQRGGVQNGGGPGLVFNGRRG
eukprot:GDKI01011148.1.p1 GENE.GDKI01011148.1~~GDKI01011148.1.p1  ORF type:complete len:856 (-),score=266.20 GDKI01011148.1:23-2428(-)